MRINNIPDTVLQQKHLKGMPIPITERLKMGIFLRKLTPNASACCHAAGHKKCLIWGTAGTPQSHESRQSCSPEAWGTCRMPLCVSHQEICRVWHGKRTWTCPYLSSGLSEGGSVGPTIAFSLRRASTNSSCQRKCSLNNDKLHIRRSISHHSCCEPVLHQVATVKILNTELAVLFKGKKKKKSLTRSWGDGDPQACADTRALRRVTGIRLSASLSWGFSE